MFTTAMVSVLRLDGEKDWATVRQQITDEKISDIYKLFATLWPLEADILFLLPKSDGFPRVVYSGVIHPHQIAEIAGSLSPYFGETLIQHPFVHARALNSDFSPIERPQAYRNEFNKAVLVLLQILPLIDAGLVNLFPDPCYFDRHLQKQMFAMAEQRGRRFAPKVEDEDGSAAYLRDDVFRSLITLSAEAVRATILRSDPYIDSRQIDEVFSDIESRKLLDPLASLQHNHPEDGEVGALNMTMLEPNFEMALYLAQVSGAVILTDSAHRWNEIRRAMLSRYGFETQ